MAGNDRDRHASDTENMISAKGGRPFRVDTPQERISEIWARIAHAKLPKQMPPVDAGASLWETGMDISWLDSLRKYWVETYDWGEAQKKLNRFSQYIVGIDGIDIHFYYVEGKGSNPRPLILSHGWPGSVVEFLDMIEPLTDPGRFGGDEKDAFTVVIPSLPGFGFSGMPKVPINAITTAKIFHRLMADILGFDRYFAQGGDFGSGITVQLAALHPEAVRGIHLNFVPWFAIPKEEQTAEERQWLADGAAYAKREFDYMRLQANKPMMPAVALVDSPLGTAAWIAEKFWAWTDHRGDLDRVVARDTLITNIMIYLVNDSGIDGSFWYYRGFRDEMGSHFFPGYVQTPTAMAIFPFEYLVCRPSLSTAKRGFNVSRFTNFETGGHFPALEVPSVLIEDLRVSFREL